MPLADCYCVFGNGNFEVSVLGKLSAVLSQFELIKISVIILRSLIGFVYFLCYRFNYFEEFVGSWALSNWFIFWRFIIWLWYHFIGEKIFYLRILSILRLKILKKPQFSIIYIEHIQNLSMNINLPFCFLSLCTSKQQLGQFVFLICSTRHNGAFKKVSCKVCSWSRELLHIFP